jgi:hypothetical protein
MHYTQVRINVFFKPLAAIAVLSALLLGASAHAQGAVEGPLPQLAGKSVETNTSAPPPSQSKLLDNAAIVKMTKADLGDEIILQTVRSQPGNYQTGPDDLVALKSAGVSQAVIAAMLARNSGLQQHPAPPPVEVTPISVNTDDPGVYFKNAQGQWEMMGPELVRYRDGGALKSVLTRDIVKKDQNGVVTGPKSKLPISLGTEMLILAPNLQTDAVEYVILRFRTKSDRREFRVKTGNVFHSETGTDRDALDIPIHKVSSRLFGFTVPRDLEKGEYGVLAPGSAATPGISHAGKVYTFSITE